SRLGPPGHGDPARTQPAGWPDGHRDPAPGRLRAPLLQARGGAEGRPRRLRWAGRRADARQADRHLWPGIRRRLLGRSAAMIRRSLFCAALAAAALGLSACGKSHETTGGGATPHELTFSILSAENQASMQPLWQPLLDDMSQQIGVPVKPFFATNYTSLVEAMRFKQVQVGWFSAAPALQAIRRADGQVLGRVIDAGGDATYKSVIIVRKGSGITLDKLLKC